MNWFRINFEVVSCESWILFLTHSSQSFRGGEPALETCKISIEDFEIPKQNSKCNGKLLTVCFTGTN